ncbi:hypothetical protein [Salinispora arenicola]|uniref:hypothetical protein n=1 Tax=Salinispora arenicola TaxID=168697 RepID=UPI0027DC8E37|nr:hypothetical protein [Salinispora arenicola]
MLAALDLLFGHVPAQPVPGGEVTHEHRGHVTLEAGAARVLVSPVGALLGADAGHLVVGRGSGAGGLGAGGEFGDLVFAALFGEQFGEVGLGAGNRGVGVVSGLPAGGDGVLGQVRVLPQRHKLVLGGLAGGDRRAQRVPRPGDRSASVMIMTPLWW